MKSGEVPVSVQKWVNEIEIADHNYKARDKSDTQPDIKLEMYEAK